MDRRTALQFLLRHGMGDESLRPAVRGRLSGLLVRQQPSVLAKPGLDTLVQQSAAADPDSIDTTKVWFTGS